MSAHSIRSVDHLAPTVLHGNSNPSRSNDGGGGGGGGGGGFFAKKPRTPGRTQSPPSQDPAAKIAANPLQFLTELYKPRGPTDGFRKYYRDLIRGAEEAIKQYPPAFVSMANGTFHDVFKDYPDVYLALAHSLKHNTVVGLCERPRKRPNGTALYPFFSDMDIYSPKTCRPEDLKFMLAEFLCPTMSEFFDDDQHRPAMQKTHFAAYYSREPGSDAISRQTKSKLVCGLCEKGTLHRSMEHMEAYAECKLCGLRFACSSTDGGIDHISTEPLMFSKKHFLKAHRARMPFAKTKSLKDPEPWTRVSDDNWDPDTRLISFDHSAMRIETKIRVIDTHIDKTTYKYGVHLKALNVEWIQRGHRFNIGRRRMLDAFLRRLKRKPPTARKAALKYCAFLKKQIRVNNKKSKTHMPPAEIQMRAAAKLPVLFLTEPMLGAAQHLVDLDKYMREEVDTLIFDKQMAIVLCDYLASKAIQWQETLPDTNFWKTIDMNEAFDKAPYSSGLRVPYAQKVLKCKHVRHKDAPDNTVKCLRCDGTGKYVETERSPYELQFIIDAQGEECTELGEYLKTNIAGQLAITSIRLPIMSKLSGTIVRETGNIIRVMRGIPRTNHDVRSGVPQSSSVQVDGSDNWHAFLGTVVEITRRDILDPLQQWIRQLRSEWAHLSIRKLKKKKQIHGAVALPSYWVDVDPRSSGALNCPYHNGDHSGGAIYFLLVPPKTKKQRKNMHGTILYYCWSGGCTGNKCTMGSRKRGHLPKQLVLRIWDPTSFVASTGSLGELAPTLRAISRRETTSAVTRAEEIQRLVGTSNVLATPFTPPNVQEPPPDPAHEGAQSTGAREPREDPEELVSHTTELSTPIDTATLYQAMHGELVVSSHARLYKQFANLCKPSSLFATMFTTMNQ